MQERIERNRRDAQGKRVCSPLCRSVGPHEDPCRGERGSIGRPRSRRQRIKTLWRREGRPVSFKAFLRAVEG